MKTLKLEIEYNGKGFFGWQKQEGMRTVQGEIEKAIFSLTGQEVAVEGSGRTDKGVHALGQVASIKIDINMPLKNFKKALNNLLPMDIFVKNVQTCQDEFHARFSAKRKTYVYSVKLSKDRDAMNFDRVAFYSYKVDVEKIVNVSKMLVGKHNFQGFCSADTTVTNFEREIYKIDISKRGSLLKFEITGNGFLYNMVRIIVGTLLEVGRGKLTTEDVQKALSTGQRKYAGITMPPQGLCLKKVEYV